MKQEFMTPKQAAMTLGVERRTIERYVKQKQIPSVRIGRSIYIPKDFMKQVGEVTEKIEP